MSTTYPQRRRAYRDPDDRFLGGVAGGVAEHLGLSALRLRVAFLLLTLLGGLGALVYAGLWVALPLRDPRPGEGQPPGIGAATRSGRRTESVPRSRRDVAVGISLLVTFAGVIALLDEAGVGVGRRFFWPAVVGSAGLVLLWWQADQSARTAWLSGRAGWRTWLRLFVGLLLVVGALALVLFQSGAGGALGTAFGALVLAALGAALVVGPWLLNTNRLLRRERAERVRNEERADLAAHLHDSVLQTLALIQRQADDPQAVGRLARTQERELRRWLFEPTDDAERLVGTALRDLAAEVEDAFGMPVEVVVVGDAPVAERYPPLLAATKEAVTNAARHSGAPQVDVYAEVGAEGAEVFVRDRGRGFDPDALPPDRFGVRGSILDRMGRHGGSAELRSEAGSGTEVRLWMPATDPMQRSSP